MDVSTDSDMRGLLGSMPKMASHANLTELSFAHSGTYVFRCLL
jgi:hypothetical protein